MLKLVPKHWFSWDFRLEDPAGMPLAEVALSSWRERGSVTAGGIHYRVSQQGFTGPFILEAAGAELARAVKVSALKQTFTVSHEERHYTLKRMSSWRREFGLFSNAEIRVGSIAPESWFTRRAHVELPEGMPIWLQAFLVWLAMLMWKRDADVTAASS